jgi:arsenite oxidase small subunit
VSDESGSAAPKQDTDEARRNFLKIAAAASAVLAFGGIASVMKTVVFPSIPASSQLSFPRVKIISLSALSTGVPVEFNYPLDNEPNYVIKLGTKSEGGVGPDGDIVAFSDVCQHLGCNWGYVPAGGSPKVNPSYVAPGPVGYCPCHASVFDLTESAKVVGGPSPRPLPQVKLEVDSSGDIYAVGMGPPSIFGHNTGSSNVSDDLQGGTLVTSTSGAS